MMRKYFVLLLLLLITTVLTISCKVDKEEVVLEIINTKVEYVLGESVKFEASINSNDEKYQTIIWKSSDDSIVSISNDGNVTFNCVGEVIITASCKDDSSINDSITIKIVTPLLESLEIVLGDIVIEGSFITGSVNTNPVYADGSVVWSSSDESVATVNENGVVTGVSIGKAIISATSKANSNITASKEVEVKVEDGSLVIPESIKISSSEIMKVGYNVTIKAIVSPSNAYQGVVWKSLDEDVLKVDAYGVATGIKEGVARLMCVSKASSNIKSNIIEIKVYEDDSRESVDLKGYKIEIMQASSALGEIDPFLYSYTKPDKLYKQEVWESVEKEYNCDLSVKPYPDLGPWATSRIIYIIDNANNNVATADLFVVIIF